MMYDKTAVNAMLCTLSKAIEDYVSQDKTGQGYEGTQLT